MCAWFPVCLWRLLRSDAVPSLHLPLPHSVFSSLTSFFHHLFIFSSSISCPILAFFSHLFSALRSAHVFPSVLIYTEDLGKYAPRYLFFSLVELFQTKYVPLETSHGAALADGHRQTTETSSVVLAIKVL